MLVIFDKTNAKLKETEQLGSILVILEVFEM